MRLHNTASMFKFKAINMISMPQKNWPKYMVFHFNCALWYFGWFLCSSQCCKYLTQLTGLPRALCQGRCAVVGGHWWWRIITALPGEVDWGSINLCTGVLQSSALELGRSYWNLKVCLINDFCIFEAIHNEGTGKNTTDELIYPCQITMMTVCWNSHQAVKKNTKIMKSFIFF